jgi:hypothetical protein
MPSTSKKQHKFMEAIAHSPSFAKKVGVPQSVGKDFSSADKGRKFSKGGDMKKFNMDRYADGGMPMPRGASPGEPKTPNPNPRPDKVKPGTYKPVRPNLKPPTILPSPPPKPSMPVRPGPRPPTKPTPGSKPVISDIYAALPKPTPGSKPVISDVYPTLPKPSPYMPGRPGAKPSPGMPVRPGPKPVISDITPMPKPTPKPMPQIMGGSADKMGPRSASAMMAKGGMAHKDVKMDKGMMQKAVNKHEGRLHKGESMTKLASGGTAKKMNMGGMAYAKGGFTKAADGIATKGKTKGMMVKMARGGKAC